MVFLGEMTACTLGLRVRISASMRWMWRWCSWTRSGSTGTKSWRGTLRVSWTCCCRALRVSDASPAAPWAALVATERWLLHTGRVRDFEGIRMGSWGCWSGEGEGGWKTTSGDNEEKVCSQAANASVSSLWWGFLLAPTSRVFGCPVMLLRNILFTCPPQSPPSLSLTVRSRATVPSPRLERIATFVIQSSPFFLGELTNQIWRSR